MADANTISTVGSQNCVLIVDDELESLRGIIDFFRNIKWKVVTAVDEKEAILEFEHVNPCLILLDLVLERESGFEVLTRIRQLDAGSRVIMISKYFDYELIKQAMKAGAIGFVQKAEADRFSAWQCGQILGTGFSSAA